MMVCSIYIIDDDPIVSESLSMVLREQYQVKTFSSAEEGITALENTPPDLLLLDIGLPGMTGINALKLIKKTHPEIVVIMITAFVDVKSVVSSMKHGAYEYIVKPVQLEQLSLILQNAFETISLRKEIRQLQERYLNENLPCFIGESDSIQNMMDVVGKVAKSSDTSVLILGETGTGKELIARAIHYRSPNFRGSLVEVNCAAIPKELIESELFGYEKGAFSGADQSGKKGLVEHAEGGTLFLDEVGDLRPEAQAKLLRFLEEGEYYKVGGIKKYSVITRVVSATNRDQLEMVERGHFRRDLFFRLAVVKIVVPSLEHRRKDIIPIAKHFLLKFSEKFGKSLSGFSSEAETMLWENNWTGNVRELKNLIEKAVLLSDGSILTPKDFEADISPKNGAHLKMPKGLELPTLAPSGTDFMATIDFVEKHYFEEALKLSKGNVSKAAALLHISRDIFRHRRRKWEAPTESQL
jgi:DNA-binding NtrC family response regulator